MSVIKHPNQSEYLNGWTDSPDYVVECSECKRLSCKRAGTPGQAAEFARGEGYITCRGAYIGEPMKWLCPDCHKNTKRIDTLRAPPPDWEDEEDTQPDNIPDGYWEALTELMLKLPPAQLEAEDVSSLQEEEMP